MLNFNNRCVQVSGVRRIGYVTYHAGVTQYQSQQMGFLDSMNKANALFPFNCDLQASRRQTVLVVLA